ncbi:hypothetical protein GE21DRAFT_1333221 [Neurospora crassa]|nr:hypothetical protein GE21DRAFT_1333221 [Neurospora crassa]
MTNQIFRSFFYPDFLLIACELFKSFEHIFLVFHDKDSLERQTRFQALQLKNPSSNVAIKQCAMTPAKLPDIVIARQNTEDLHIEERRSKRTSPEGKPSEPIEGISHRASLRITIVASGIALGHQKN